MLQNSSTSKALAHLHFYYGRVSSSFLHRHRRSDKGGNSSLELELSVFNKTFSLYVRHNRELISPFTTARVLHNGHVEGIAGSIPDCYLEGFTQHRGSVALSYCDGIVSCTSNTRRICVHVALFKYF